MRKAIRIVNIDGTEGIGKSVQVSMLANFLREKKIPSKIIYLEDNIESANEVAKSTKEFLEKEEKGIAICDGSIARMMVKDLLASMHKDKIVEKYKEVIYEYEVMTHKYGTANLLLIMDDIEEASSRVKKREKLLGKVSEGIKNKQLEKDIIKCLKSFDNYTITNQVNFDVINIYMNDSIMDINVKIIKYLQDNFIVS